MIDKQEWETELHYRYDNLTREQFVSLIGNVLLILKDHIDDPYVDLVKDIARTAWQTKEITFRQWKSLNAFVNKHTRIERKSFA